MSNDEIKTNSLVVNTSYYDSEEDIDDDNFEDINEDDSYYSCDEETFMSKEIISQLLEEIACVNPLGKGIIRVEFYNPRGINFVDKEEDCDFDINEEGYPILPDGGEDFFLPFMKKVKECNSEICNLTIETNVKGFKFKI